jgi:hypothetical protein
MFVTSIARSGKKYVKMPVIISIIDTYKIGTVSIHEAYILMLIQIVYLDGNTAVYMILKVGIFGQRLAVFIHESSSPAKLIMILY